MPDRCLPSNLFNRENLIAIMNKAESFLSKYTRTESGSRLSFDAVGELGVLYNKLLMSATVGGNPEWIAYILATVQWETASTFKPVKEAFWLSEEWRKANLRYYPYYGRGYVQLTWETNYRKMSDALGLPIVEHPDIALKPKHAYDIMVTGMLSGMFTGQALRERRDNEDLFGYFLICRQIINGNDRKYEVAEIAVDMLECMGNQINLYNDLPMVRDVSDYKKTSEFVLHEVLLPKLGFESIKDYQSSKDLIVDGICGDRTWSAIVSDIHSGQQ